MKIKPTGFITFIISIMLFSCYGSAFSTEKTYNIRMQVPVPAGYLNTFENFSKDVETASAGKIKIRVFSAGQLVPFSEEINAVKSGTLDMAVLAPGYHSGLQLSDLLGSLPMGWRNLDEALLMIHRMQNSRISELIKEDISQNGVTYIGSQWAGSVSLLSKRPIRSIDDFKGLKVECTGKVTQEWFKKLGAEPYTIPVEETYTSLATGIIDASFSGSAGFYEAVGFTETAKFYHTPYPVNAFIAPVIINDNLWESMSDDLKKIMYLANFRAGIESQLNETYSDFIARHKKVQMVNWNDKMLKIMRNKAMEAMELVEEKGPLASEFIKVFKEEILQFE